MLHMVKTKNFPPNGIKYLNYFVFNFNAFNKINRKSIDLIIITVLLNVFPVVPFMIGP